MSRYNHQLHFSAQKKNMYYIYGGSMWYRIVLWLTRRDRMLLWSLLNRTVRFGSRILELVRFEYMTCI